MKKEALFKRGLRFFGGAAGAMGLLFFCLAVPANATSTIVRTMAGVQFDNPYYSHSSGGYGTTHAFESYGAGPPLGSFASALSNAPLGTLGAHCVRSAG